MKKWKLWLAAVFFAGMQQILLPLPVGEAASVPFTVCGQSAAGDQNAALQDAQKRAVKRALLQYLSLDNPEFEVLFARYQEFAAPPQVFEKKKQGARLMLFSKVAVNIDALRAELANSNMAKQERHEDHNACFFVRVVGMADEATDDRGQEQIVNTYRDAFERLGFQLADEDGLAAALKKYRSMPYETFWPQLRDDICVNYENVQLAVTGEIVISKRPQAGVGTSRAGVVRLKAIDMQTKKVIAEVEDSYEVRRDKPEEADQFILAKAAVNSARALADQTAAYWQNH